MKAISMLVVLTFLALASALQDLGYVAPPHCTELTEEIGDTDYQRHDYPAVFIESGDHEHYEGLYCSNPKTISETATKVCDWVAPPLVEFTLGYKFIHVVRQDPSGLYNDKAIIYYYQKCDNNTYPQEASDSDAPTVVKLH